MEFMRRIRHQSSHNSQGNGSSARGSSTNTTSNNNGHCGTERRLRGHSSGNHDDDTGMLHSNSPSTLTLQNRRRSQQCKRKNNYILDNPDKSVVHFKLDAEYPPIWSQYRKSKTLCDGTIHTSDGKVYHVHRAIMAAASPFFRALFVNTIEGDNGKELNEVELKSVDSATLENLIEFAYTGKCDVTRRNVDKLLPVADQYQMLGIVQQCCKFLLDQLNAENCISMFKFAKTYFCKELENKARMFVLTNFREICQSTEFIQMEFDQLEDFLRDDRLNVRNEGLVFQAIKKWVEHDPSHRISKINELLQCVRFGLMSYSFFTNTVLKWKYIQENSDVQTSLFNASMFLASMESLNGSEIDLNDPLARPRIPNEIVFAVGGWSAGSPTSFMETYDVRADRWFLNNGSDITPRAYHGLVCLSNLIYMIGGFDGNDHFSSVRCFNPISKEWIEKACMFHPRCYVSCTTLGGLIYACGGYNGRIRMSTVERYNPQRNQWELICPMNRQRSDASACALGDKVYIAGGFTGTEVLNSVEVYSVEENQWTFVHPMNSPRSGVSMVAYKNSLFVLGGFNGFTRLSSCENYDPENSSEWQFKAEMSSPRSNFSAIVADDLIICIGGFNGTTTIPYVECFDSDLNEWFDGAPMNLNRSALSACVVKDLPNAHEYSYLFRVHELLGISFST